MKYLWQMVQLLVPVLVGWALCRGFGALPATGIALVCAVAFPAVGAVLLRSIVGEEITWRNLLGGWLLPWGYTIGRGKLPAIAVISGVVWALLFGVGIMVGRPEAAAPTTALHPAPSGFISFLLVLSWAADGTVLLYFAGMLSRNTDISRRPGSTQAKIFGMVCLLIGVSFVFWLMGKPTTALWIAGFPPLVCGTLFGAWVLLLVTVGRNARWN